MGRKRWQAAVVAAMALVGLGLSAGGAGASPTRVAGSVRNLRAIAPDQVTGGPTDISCPTTAWCAAIGTLDESGGALPGGTDFYATATAAWVYRAGSWRVGTLPLPPDAVANTLIDLSGISCAKAGHCVAVASYVTTASHEALAAETLSGGAWHVTKVPLAADTYPFPDFVDQHHDVSCPTVTSCVAVANVFEKNGHFTEGAAAYRLEAGRWTARVLPSPKGGREPLVDGVSCAAAGRCVAVGQQFSSSSSDNGALVETLRGGTWKATSLGGAKASTTALQSVSCPAVGSCVAVGSRSPNDGTGTPFTARLKAGRWTTHAFALKDSGLSGVSCASVTACTAVGSTQRRGQSTTPLIATLSSGRWTLHEPAGRAALDVVSCPAADRCWSTVGYDSHDRVDTVDGSRLGATPLPLPTGPPAAALAAVSCSSADRCVAVGGYSSVSGDQNLIETRGATGAWTPTTGVAVKGADAGFYGVSCAPRSSSGSGCVAVGNNAVAVLSAGRWRDRLLPVPTGSRDVIIDAVSCPAVNRCVAVGTIEPAHSSHDVPLVAVLTGTRWKVTALPLPSGDIYSDLTGVSCPSIGNCMAVGTSSPGPDESAGLSELLEHGTWTAGSPGGYPAAVACPRTTSWCVAAAGGTVDRWNGSGWSSRDVGKPDTGDNADAVSCWGARSCTVAGDDGNQTTGLWVIAVSPTHVSIRQAVSAPAGSEQDTLNGIACPTARCTVVGGDSTVTSSYAVAGTVSPAA